MNRAKIVLWFILFEALFSNLNNQYFLKDVSALFLFYIIWKFLLTEHISFYVRFIKIFIISSNWIICQMNKFVMHLFWIIVNGWKSYIALVVYPYSQRVEICHQNPLSYVKFPFQYYKRILYIFLSNPKRFFAFDMIMNFYKVIITSYSSSSW